MNDVFGLGRKVRVFGRERVRKTLAGLGGIQAGDAAEEAGQADRAHPQAAAAEEFAARQSQVFEIWRVM